jgi:hypothetical protein
MLYLRNKEGIKGLQDWGIGRADKYIYYPTNHLSSIQKNTEITEIALYKILIKNMPTLERKGKNIAAVELGDRRCLHI